MEAIFKCKTYKNIVGYLGTINRLRFLEEMNPQVQQSRYADVGWGRKMGWEDKLGFDVISSDFTHGVKGD